MESSCACFCAIQGLLKDLPNIQLQIWNERPRDFWSGWSNDQWGLMATDQLRLRLHATCLNDHRSEKRLDFVQKFQTRRQWICSFEWLLCFFCEGTKWLQTIQHRVSGRANGNRSVLSLKTSLIPDADQCGQSEWRKGRLCWISTGRFVCWVTILLVLRFSIIPQLLSFFTITS